MPTNPTRHTKGLIDLLSMHTYEETLKEIEFRKANPTAPMEQDQQSIGIGGGSNDRLGIQNQNQGLGGVNSGIFMNRHMKPVTEDLLKHVQEIVTDYYKQHTVEVICYCLQELIPYNTELKEGDTFLHRLVEFGQVEAAKHALNLGIDPEIRTAISHKQFPRKFFHFSEQYLNKILQIRRDVTARGRCQWVNRLGENVAWPGRKS